MFVVDTVTGFAGLRVDGAAAGRAIVAVELVCAACIPEPAMAAADGRGGSAAIPVGAGVEVAVLEEPPVLGLAAFPPAPTVDQALPATTVGVVAGTGVDVCLGFGT